LVPDTAENALVGSNVFRRRRLGTLDDIIVQVVSSLVRLIAYPPVGTSLAHVMCTIDDRVCDTLASS